MQRPRFTPTRIALLFGLLAIVLYGALVTSQIVFPKQGAEQKSDVIVSLAPELDRLPLAQHLFEKGLADTLAISHPVSEKAEAVQSSSASRPCMGEPEPNIICFTPSVSETLGEATRVSELANEYDWESVTVVTSRYHAFRSQFIFERCLPDNVEVQVVHSETKLGVGGWLFHIAYEHVAFAKALYETSTQCR